VPTNGEHNFTIEIPDGVPSGSQTLFVSTPGTTEDTDIVVGAAALIATPATVVPNQRVSIIGTGFTEGGQARINESGFGATADPDAGGPCTQPSTITIGGEQIHPSRINDGETIEVDNGGSWSASIDLPVTSATTTEGPRELKATDCQGREGTVDLIFPDRQITINPPEGRVSTNVTVTGTGFPAKNNDGNSITVDVEYDAGGGGTNSASATPDAGGRWQVTLQVPSDAAIPSTNTVRATFPLFLAGQVSTQSGTEGITTVTHRVPQAQITLDTVSGPPGTQVTLNGVGFKRFTPVNTVTVGDIEVTPAPKPSTGALGGINFQFIVPGADTGVQTVEVDVGGTTASVGFTITEEGGFGDSVRSPIREAFAPLFEGNALDRAFIFNNNSKQWDFFINNEQFMAVNTFSEVPSGAPMWIRVNESTNVELRGRMFNLTCVNPGTPEEDCWNLIVFP
jgi:hypothetical protein